MFHRSSKKKFDFETFDQLMRAKKIVQFNLNKRQNRQEKKTCGVCETDRTISKKKKI